MDTSLLHVAVYRYANMHCQKHWERLSDMIICHVYDNIVAADGLVPLVSDAVIQL